MLRRCAVTIAVAAVLLGLNTPARADIIDEWSAVAAPAPPALKPVALDTKTTALLMLDFLPLNCGSAPRCIAILPKVRALLDAARAAHVLVIYSEFQGNTLASVLPQVAALGNEPNVIAAGDKFIESNLDQILKTNGIKTVVVTGVAANGAVLYTASDAAMRGYKVVVPVDTMEGTSPYAEQFAAVQMTLMPGAAQNVTLTRSPLVKF